jgi:hypothetical protein
LIATAITRLREALSRHSSLVVAVPLATVGREAYTAIGLFAIMLGTNEGGSAIGVHLSRAGYCVGVSHDHHPLIIRRKISLEKNIGPA